MFMLFKFAVVLWILTGLSYLAKESAMSLAREMRININRDLSDLIDKWISRAWGGLFVASVVFSTIWGACLVLTFVEIISLEAGA